MTPTSETPGRLTACVICDLLQTVPDRPGKGAVRCARCGSQLYRSNPQGLERSLALFWAVLSLFILANCFPIVRLQSQGIEREASLPEAALWLWDDQNHFVAALVYLTTFVAPGIEIIALTGILTCLRFDWPLPGLRLLMRLAVLSRPWSMLEVFMLGILVSVVKLSHLAAITPGIALWSYGIMILLFAGAMANLDTHALWNQLDANH